MSYTLYYHTACTKFIGRAHAPLMILNEAGAKFEIKEPGEVPAGTTGFAVPIVTFPEGFTIGQQGAIAAALGKSLGLYPKDAKGEAVAHNLVENMMDLIGDASKADEARMTKWFGTFEAALKESGSGFFVGDSLTYVDLACYFPLKLAKEKDKAPFPELLAKWDTMMAETKGAKAVAAMGLPMMPG